MKLILALALGLDLPTLRHQTTAWAASLTATCGALEARMLTNARNLTVATAATLFPEASLLIPSSQAAGPEA